MRFRALVLLSLLFVTACAAPALESDQDKTQESSASSSAAASNENAVTITSPVAGSRLVSPVVVTGTAPGTWFSEGQIPVEIVAADGVVVARESAMAQGEWMTEQPVPFEATINFSTTATHGTLRVKKDNPSGLPANDGSYELPVSF